MRIESLRKYKTLEPPVFLGTMSRRMETRHQSRRAASKEALKQMQLMTAFDDDDSTEAYEITSDEDVRVLHRDMCRYYI